MLKNKIFLNEIMLLHFKKEDIINYFCKLDEENAEYLYKKYFETNITEISEMILYILRKDLNYMNNKLNENEITLKYEKIYDGEKSENDLLDFYNRIIIMQRKYDNRNFGIEELGNFVMYLKKVFGIDDINIDQETETLVSNLISFIITSKIKIIELINNKDIEVLYYKAKYNCKPLKNLPYTVDNLIKSKNVIDIYNKLIKNNKEIEENINYDIIIKAIISMISYLGINASIKIVTNMPKNMQICYKILYAFEKIDLKTVKIENNKIIYDKEFINFIMGDNLKEPNSFLNLMYVNKNELIYKIEDIYYNWDIIKKRFKKQNYKTKYSFVKKIINSKQILLELDEEMIREQLEICLDNKKFVKISDNELIDITKKLYKKIKHKYQKNIPYENTTIDGINFEILKANDLSLFTLGCLSDCCFKVGGKAERFLNYCLLNDNGRVLVIKKDNVFLAMVPLVLKGNALIFNSVECINKTEEYHRFLIEKLIKFSNHILSYKGIDVVLLGNYIYDIYKLNIVEQIKFDENLKKIFEDYIYKDDHNIDDKCYLLAGNLNKLDINYQNILYEDPRNKIRIIENDYDGIEVEKNELFDFSIINSIYYEKYGKELEENDFDRIIYNDDWFILIKNNKIISVNNSLDERGIFEYNEYLDMEIEYCKYLAL